MLSLHCDDHVTTRLVHWSSWEFKLFILYNVSGTRKYSSRNVRENTAYQIGRITVGEVSVEYTLTNLPSEAPTGKKRTRHQ